MGRLVVSQNERLLLHLTELDRFREEPEVPLAASQEGIAKALQTQVHNASRALSLLEAEGLITDRLAHVRGAPKRRRAYFLTEKGRKTVEAMKADMMKRKVVFEHAGRAQRMTVEEALKSIASLSGRMPSFLEFVDLGRAKDVINIDDIAKKRVEKAAPKSFPTRAHGRPPVETFFGRQNEKKQIEEALYDENVSTVLIWGIPGIGKSTLGSRVFEERQGVSPTFWYTFREWDTMSSFLGTLASYLKLAGMMKTASSVDRQEPLSDLFFSLVKDLEGSNTVIFLDDVHKASKQLNVLISVLVEAARTTRSASLVLMSRSIPGPFPAGLPGTLKLELRGLDAEAAAKMAESEKVRDISRAVEISHGHPLLLKLMSRGSVSEAREDVIDFLEYEVYLTAAPEERRVLELLSIFRHPVEPEALRTEDYSVIADLKQRALIAESDDGLWIHEIVRDFFRSRLTADMRTDLHENAGEYCAGRDGVEWALEALYHLIIAKRWNRARQIFLSNADELERDFPAEALALGVNIPLEDSSTVEQMELLFSLGRLNESLGMNEEAIANYERSLAVAEESTRGGDRARILETLGKLQTVENKWSESLESHQKALKLYEDAKDMDGLIREWLNIGSAYKRRGDSHKARESYENALSIAAKEENRPGQAACLNNLALLDWSEGRLRDSEIRLKESIRLAHAVRDHAGEARGLENLADLFRTQMRTGEAANLLWESAESYRRAGEIDDFKRLLAASAEALGSVGKLDEAIEICRRTLEKPELRRRPGLFQRTPRYDDGDFSLSSILIDLLKRSGDPKAAAAEGERLSRMAESLRNPQLMAKARLELALTSEDSGDLTAAVGHLKEAEELLKGVGDREGLVAVHIRRGTVEEKMGNEAEALAHYEEALRQAETAGSLPALAYSLENLALASGIGHEKGSAYLARAIDTFSRLGQENEADRLRRIAGN